MKRKTGKLQQGDVLFRPCDEPKGKRELVPDGIVAHGEATGHKHRVRNAKVYRIGGELYVNLDGTVTYKPKDVVHEEHDAFKLKSPTGWLKVGRVQELDHFTDEAREVAD